MVHLFDGLRLLGQRLASSSLVPAKFLWSFELTQLLQANDTFRYGGASKENEYSALFSIGFSN